MVSCIYKYNKSIQNEMEFDIIIPYPRTVLYNTILGECDILRTSLQDMNIANQSVLLIHPME